GEEGTGQLDFDPVAHEKEKVKIELIIPFNPDDSNSTLKTHTFLGNFKNIKSTLSKVDEKLLISGVDGISIEASGQQLPAILLPTQILCKVVNVQLWVEEDIANTMDLPDKLLPRSSNRMGKHITTCNFKKSLGVVSRDH
nr:ribosomal RNA small subunit methyltransferase h [Tanacetum cinerariifolium]